MSNIIIQGNEINARKYLEKITIEGIGEEKTLNPRIIVVNEMIKYSTEEHVIGTWIDGKPLYQKVITFGAVEADSSLAIDLSQLNIGIIIDRKAIALNTLRDTHIQIPSALPPTAEEYQIYIGNYDSYSKGKITIYTGSEIGIDSGMLIVQYTKTTD